MFSLIYPLTFVFLYQSKFVTKSNSTLHLQYIVGNSWKQGGVYIETQAKNDSLLLSALVFNHNANPNFKLFCHSNITYFNKAFAAAVGPEKQLNKLTLQMDTKHQILYSEHYLTHEKRLSVMHHSAIYLIDPQARFYAVFTPPHSPQLVRNRYISIGEEF
jgi:hypothetical protein